MVGNKWCLSFGCARSYWCLRGLVAAGGCKAADSVGSTIRFNGGPSASNRHQRRQAMWLSSLHLSFVFHSCLQVALRVKMAILKH